MSWTRGLRWNHQGTAWRGSLSTDALDLETPVVELPALHDDDAGWVAPRQRLAEGWEAQATGPRRLELRHGQCTRAEVWAMSRRARWGRPEARRALRTLHGLRARGYGAPRPLGWVAPRSNGVSFLLHEPLSAPTVSSHVRRGLGAADARSLAKTTAELLRKLAYDGLLDSRLRSDRIRWQDGSLVLCDVAGLRRTRPGLGGFERHLRCLARDPVTAQVSSWTRARCLWLALSGHPARRSRFRRWMSVPEAQPPATDATVATKARAW